MAVPKSEADRPCRPPIRSRAAGYAAHEHNGRPYGHLTLSWSREKTNRLLRDYRKTGNIAAREELYEYYIDLVGFYTLRYSGRGAENDDLFQEGSLGLLAAIERFDPSLGFQFSTYASALIKGRIRQHFRNFLWPCHVPRGCKEMSLRIHQLAGQLGHDPSEREIIDGTDIPAEKVREAIEASRVWATVPLSEDESGSDPRQTTLSPYRCIDMNLAAANDRLSIDDAMNMALTDEEARVVRLYYFEDLPQREVAQRMDTYQMQVSRMLHRSIIKMGDYLQLGEARIS